MIRHETNKKIADLTKIIYDLNVKVQRYEEELQVDTIKSREELQLTITNQQNEILALKQELEVKEDAVVKLKNLLAAQTRREEANDKLNREKHEGDVKKMQNKINDMEQILDKNQSEMLSLSQLCDSLRAQLEEALIKGEDKHKFYQDELSNLRDAHENHIALITKEAESTLDRIQLNHKANIEMIETSLNDDYNNKMKFIETKYKNKVENIRSDMMLDFNSKMKQLVDTSSHEIEALNVAKESLRLEMTTTKAQLISVHKSIKCKDSTIDALQSSIDRAIEDGKRHLKEREAGLGKMDKTIKAKDEELMSEKSKVLHLQEKVVELKAKCDNHLQLSLSLTDANKILQLGLADAEGKRRTMQTALSDATNYSKHNRNVLMLCCDKMSTTIKNLKSDQVHLIQCTIDNFLEIKSMLHDLRISWNKSRVYVLECIEAIKAKMSQELQNAEFSKRECISRLQHLVNTTRIRLQDTEQQYEQEKDMFDIVKNDLEQKNAEMHLIVETDNIKISELSRQVDIMKCTIDGLNKFNSKLKGEMLLYETQQQTYEIQLQTSASKVKNLENQLQATLDENKQNSINSIKLTKELERSLLSSEKNNRHKLKEKDKLIQVMQSKHENSIRGILNKLSNEMGNIKSEIERRIQDIKEASEQQIRQIHLFHNQELQIFHDNVLKQVRQSRNKIGHLCTQNKELNSTKNDLEKKYACIQNEMKTIVLVQEQRERDIAAKANQIALLHIEKDAELRKLVLRIRETNQQAKHYEREMTQCKLTWKEGMKRIRYELSCERYSKAQLLGQLDLSLRRLGKEKADILKLNKKVIISFIFTTSIYN